jgi:hypothetical protein
LSSVLYEIINYYGYPQKIAWTVFLSFSDNHSSFSNETKMYFQTLG